MSRFETVCTVVAVVILGAIVVALLAQGGPPWGWAAAGAWRLATVRGTWYDCGR